MLSLKDVEEVMCDDSMPSYNLLLFTDNLLIYLRVHETEFVYQLCDGMYCSKEIKRIEKVDQSDRLFRN